MRPLLLSTLGLSLLSGIAAAEPTTVNYSMSIAGLPIGSAVMVLNPNGSSTSLTISGRAGGPLEIGRMSLSATVAPGQVSAQSQSGSGSDATSARLTSRGNGPSSAFAYSGQTSRGPGKIDMTVAGGRVTALDASIPDNPQAVRVPVTDAHKSGVVDPLQALARVVKPGGMFEPDGVCGKSLGVFSGQARVNLTGTAAQPAQVSGLPDAWTAVGCSVTFQPVSGYRIDKNRNAGQSRTARLVFARSPDGKKTVLWSMAVAGTFGSFALNASSIK
jgi:hypothetical protein